MNQTQLAVLAGSLSSVQPANQNSDEWRQWAVTVMAIMDGIESLMDGFDRASFLRDTRQ